MGITSIWQWLIVLVILVLVFGTAKLRNIGRDLGGAVHDFKKGLNEGSAEVEQEKADYHASQPHGGDRRQG